MRVEIIKCDSCKADGALGVSVFIDRCMDAAGSMENEYRTVDLCHKCAIRELQRFLSCKFNVKGYIVYGSDFVNRIVK